MNVIQEYNTVMMYVLTDDDDDNGDYTWMHDDNNDVDDDGDDDNDSDNHDILMIHFAFLARTQIKWKSTMTKTGSRRTQRKNLLRSSEESQQATLRTHV